jgi:hypothetical protein
VESVQSYQTGHGALLYVQCCVPFLSLPQAHQDAIHCTSPPTPTHRLVPPIQPPTLTLMYTRYPAYVCIVSFLHLPHWPIRFPQTSHPPPPTPHPTPPPRPWAQISSTPTLTVLYGRDGANACVVRFLHLPHRPFGFPHIPQTQPPIIQPTQQQRRHCSRRCCRIAATSSSGSSVGCGQQH